MREGFNPLSYSPPSRLCRSVQDISFQCPPPPPPGNNISGSGPACSTYIFAEFPIFRKSEMSEDDRMEF